MSCQTRFYGWSCPECDGRVKVLECSCGSFVMFDKAGDGWPQHACFDRRYRDLVARVMPIVNAGRDPASARFRPFQDLRAQLGPGAGPDVDGEPPPDLPPDLSPGPVGPPPRPPAPAAPDIKRMDAIDGERQSMIGLLRSIDRKTNRLSALYQRLGDLGRKMLGLPAASKAVQVTVLDNQGQPVESYAAIADSGLITSDIAVDHLVWVELEGRTDGHAPFWVVRDIRRL